MVTASDSESQKTYNNQLVIRRWGSEVGKTSMLRVNDPGLEDRRWVPFSGHRDTFTG